MLEGESRFHGKLQSSSMQNLTILLIVQNCTAIQYNVQDRSN